MKAKLLCILAIIFISISTITSFSAPETVKVVVNGNVLQTDTPAVIRNSRTMVPFRALFESLGATDITWNEPTQTVTGSNGTITVKLVIGSYDMEVNGKMVTMDTPPMIINSRTMIPLSIVSSSLGANVGWDPKEYIATVTKGDVSPNVDISQIPNNDQQNNQSNTDIFDSITDNKNSNTPSPTPPPPTSNVVNTAKISGYYVMEDLKRNKYVVNFDQNSKVNLINISNKSQVQGTYSYTNASLNLNVSTFKSSYSREDIKYNNSNIILMKDNTNPTSASTFALLSIKEEEYKKYLPK